MSVMQIMEEIAKTILEIPGAQPLSEHLDGASLSALISGLSPVNRACLASALSLSTERSVFVLCPDETSMAEMANDMRSLLGIEPLCLAARELTLLAVQSASHLEEQARVSVLDALSRGENFLTLCTVSGMMQRSAPPEAIINAAFDVALGETRSPDEIIGRLSKIGYIRSEQVEGNGQFSKRGGILDIFSPRYPQPVRIEFWGDEINSMGFFDIESQRRVEEISAARILPASEILPGGGEGVISLASKIRALAKKIGSSKKGANPKLIKNLNEDAERLLETGRLACLDRYVALLYDKVSTVLDYLPKNTLIFISEPGKCAQRAAGYEKQQREDIRSLIEAGAVYGPLAEFSRPFSDCCGILASYPVIMADSFALSRYPIEPKSILSLSCKQLPGYGGSIDTAITDLKDYLRRGYRVVILAGDERRANIMRERLLGSGISVSTGGRLGSIPLSGGCIVSVGSLSAGIEYPDASLAVLTDTQMAKAGQKKSRRRAGTSSRPLDNYADLSKGDLVVHEYHGIGRFDGFIKMSVDGIEKDYIKINFAGKDCLYVPATQLDLVSKYIGAGEDSPVRLSKMGGAEWTKTRTRAKAAAREMAKELIALYAARKRVGGYAFAPDSGWQTEFENAFAYVETEDQLRCVREIKGDMESPAPMDRLLCGDVGYGKTEVALRAVMKCVLCNKQAAILVPTTVLARQHHQTAMQRFFGFPVRIEVLSRFRSAAQIKETIKSIRSGSVDIVIGTHRLIQKDVVFKDLGILIVDEEQRFGVRHKERLKEMSKNVDVLTLSATPIPRTLNMALSGIRDMSTIEEPPQDRIPVRTYVLEHDWDVLVDAISREIQRGGQVYYLHNRIENIERVASRLSNMLEGVSIACAHGKMAEEELSSVMDDMASGAVQVLVCTTIIETGIDIPNVNTLIIEDADKLGLAQLHQIRGRVGRSSRRASAYLTFRRDKVLSEIAEKRLAAICEFAEFNSGFKIAMRDLEIRGAGNLLGAEQHGHMIDVGYDMYLKLLREAVLEERGEKPEIRAECAADLAVNANIPEEYMPSAEQRMDLYRRIAHIGSEDEADDLIDEMIDRFGELPPSVHTLVKVALLRNLAGRAGICDISQRAERLRFTLQEFDMQRISELYAKPEYKGLLRVEAGQKPCVSLRLRPKTDVIDLARSFSEDLAAAGEDKGGNNDYSNVNIQ